MTIQPYEPTVLPSATDQRSVVARIVDRVRDFLTAGGSYQSIPYGYMGGAYSAGWWWADGELGRPGPQVTEASTLGTPAYGRGVELIASTVAGVELRAYRYDATTQIDVRIDPAPELLRDPDPVSTPWNWKYALVEDLIQFGNHFARLGDPNAEGWPRWLVPVDATQVEFAVDQASGLAYWRIGKRDIVPFGELFHVSAGNRSGKMLGRSKMVQYADALGGLMSTDVHARRYFRSGGLPSGVLKVNDPDLTPEQAAMYKKRYRETVGSGSQEPLVVPSFVDFTPVVSDAEKQQLVAARQWDAGLAAMILGIPSSYLGLPGPTMTYSNIESADIGFVRDTVDRWAKPIEAAVTKWLLPRGQTARFDWSGRMRTDSTNRATVLKTEIEAGVLTKDEGRQMLNRPPVGVVEDTSGADPTTVTANTNPTPEVIA